MVGNLINGKVEYIPWFKTWFVNLFGFVFGKIKVLKCPLSRKCDFSLFGYKVWWMGRLKVSLDLKHDVNLFCFVIGNTKVLEWPLSWKRDFSLFGYKVW